MGKVWREPTKAAPEKTESTAVDDLEYVLEDLDVGDEDDLEAQIEGAAQLFNRPFSAANRRPTSAAPWYSSTDFKTLFQIRFVN